MYLCIDWYTTIIEYSFYKLLTRKLSTIRRLIKITHIYFNCIKLRKY